MPRQARLASLLAGEDAARRRVKGCLNGPCRLRSNPSPLRKGRANGAPSWRGAVRDDAIQLVAVPSWIASPKRARNDDGESFMHQGARKRMRTLPPKRSKSFGEGGFCACGPNMILFTHDEHSAKRSRALAPPSLKWTATGWRGSRFSVPAPAVRGGRIPKYRQQGFP